MTDPQSQGVQSVARALRLLHLLSQQDEGARVSDLARLAGLAVSTTHRLLTTLELQHFAQFDSERALACGARRVFGGHRLCPAA